MKLTILFLVFGLLNSFAAGYSQDVILSVNIENGTLTDLFNTIEQNTEYKVFYKSSLINENQIINLHEDSKLVSEILHSVLPSKNLTYDLVDKVIIITSTQAANQQLKVEGTITDAITNELLVGVNIQIEGTTIGAISDVNGKFTIEVPNIGSTLILSYVGYITQKVVVSGQSSLDIKLDADVTNLEEVVVIGYGTVKKSDLTGSVSSVSTRDFGDRQISDIGSLIQGKVSGVDVAQGKIRVRGATTFNNTDPLIVIDGFIGGNLETVNANDIESIEILKDASATAIYGSRGANGVILVSTKGGKVGKLRVNLSAYAGIAVTPKKLDVLNSSQYIDYLTDAFENSGQILPDALKSPDVRKDITVWQDETFRTAHTSEINLDFSGGSDKTTYFMSIGYKTNESITIGPRYSTLYIRNKNDFNISKWFHIGNNFAFNYYTSKGTQPNIQWAIQMPQYFPIYDPTNLGGYSAVDRNTGADGANPLVSNLSHPASNILGYQTNLWAEIKPFKGLTYRIQAGVSGNFQHEKSWQDAYIVAIGSVPVKNGLSEEYSNSFNPLIENTLTYNHLFGRHDFMIMVGNSWQNYMHGGSMRISAEEFANTEVKNVFLGNSKSINEQESWNDAFLSYFGRLNYQFNNKYLLTINIRRDGSPRFSPENRWGTFPSVAVAWKMHEEGFIKNLNVFDQLKIRASWGISGNDRIPPFMYTSQVWTNGVYYPLGGVPVPGATVKDNSSPLIKWESTESKTFGTDMAFLNNSLTFTAEYFIKSSNDILFDVPRPSSLGYGLAYGGNAIVNAASVENKGFELQVGYRGKVSDLGYSVNANYTNVKNEVTGLGLGQPFLSGVSRTDIGNPIGYFYGYVADGVFMNQAELDAANELAVSKGFDHFQEAPTSVGDVRFKDVNGDGHITGDGDRQKIGNSIPKNIFGLNLTLDYKGIDFNIFFQGITGSDIYYNVHEYMRGGNTNRNQEAYLLDRWKSESDPGNGIVPRAVLGDPNLNNRPSTNMVSSGNYLKLRQLSLGYTLPGRFTDKVGIRNVRIYANGNNLLTFSKYHGYDPEVGGDNLYRGIDNLSYPIPRSMVLGIQFGF